MIRKFNINELEIVMEIWLNTNIEAHDFVNTSYWQRNYDMVRNMFPDASIFVYEDNDQIQGYIGLMDNYIAGMFINSSSQSKGIGNGLLNYAMAINSELLLKVYKKNVRAVKFYLRENFKVLKEQIDENTDEVELVMKWIR